jgi:lysine/ornithine N-monooxygenase
MKKYLCWFAHREPYVPYKTMVKRMVRSTSSSSNVHEVIDENNNSYRNMVMNVMRMN